MSINILKQQIIFVRSELDGVIYCHCPSHGSLSPLTELVTAGTSASTSMLHPGQSCYCVKHFCRQQISSGQRWYQYYCSCSCGGGSATRACAPTLPAQLRNFGWSWRRADKLCLKSQDCYAHLRLGLRGSLPLATQCLLRPVFSRRGDCRLHDDHSHQPPLRSRFLKTHDSFSSTFC